MEKDLKLIKSRICCKILSMTYREVEKDSYFIVDNDYSIIGITEMSIKIFSFVTSANE